MGYINPAFAVNILLPWVSKSGKNLKWPSGPTFPYLRENDELIFTVFSVVPDGLFQPALAKCCVLSNRYTKNLKNITFKFDGCRSHVSCLC